MVPRLGLHHIQVGRRHEVEALLQDIERIADGGATLRLVVGDFGSGKTFWFVAGIGAGCGGLRVEKHEFHQVQTVAATELLIARWYEPPDVGRLHFSTLIQQVLSLIAQHGGVKAPEAWSALGRHGPRDVAVASLTRAPGHRDLGRGGRDDGIPRREVSGARPRDRRAPPRRRGRRR